MKHTQIQFSAVNFTVKALKNGAEKGYCRFISDKSILSGCYALYRIRDN